MNAPARKARTSCDNIARLIVVTKNELAAEKRQLEAAKRELHELQQQRPPNPKRIAEAKAEVARLEELIDSTHGALDTAEAIFNERCRPGPDR